MLVIDNSSAFRYKDDVPLCIPEINIGATKGKKLVANPNCTTAIALMALAPIHRKYGIKRVIMSTYQAASGAGAPGMQELKDGMADMVRQTDRPYPLLSFEALTTLHRFHHITSLLLGRRSPSRQQSLRTPAALQHHPAHRRLPAQRVHQGGDEGRVGDEEDSRRAGHEGK